MLLVCTLVLFCGCAEEQSDIFSLNVDPAAGETVTVEVTPELRGEFFDLAQRFRWDFLPEFTQKSELLQSDFAYTQCVYWVEAQSLVWSDYYNIDHEATPDELTTVTVDRLLSVSLDLSAEELAELYEQPMYKFELDGEKYLFPPSGWKNPPLYQLKTLQLENDGQNLIYHATLWEYLPAEYGDMVEDAREQLMNEVVASELVAENALELSFYQADAGELVYLSVETAQ